MSCCEKKRELVLSASSAKTATANYTPPDASEHRGVFVVIDVSAVAATPSVVFTIQGYDPASASWYTILASAAITGTGQTILRVHPELTAAANLVAKDVLPRQWRVNATHADADSITFSLGAILLP